MMKLSEKTKGTMADVGILLIRVFVGGCLAAHGFDKFFGEHDVSGFAKGLESMGFPLPTVSAYLSAGTELIAGILIAIGLFTRLASIPMVINMLVAALAVHAKGGYFLPKGLEYALNLAMTFAGIGLIGPGRFSVDNLICKCDDKNTTGK